MGKKRKMQEEQAATEEASKLRKQEDDDIEAKKKALRENEEEKIEDLAYKHMVEQAKAHKASKSWIQRRKEQQHWDNLSKEEKAAIDKHMETDKHCKSIMKNLVAT